MSGPTFVVAILALLYFAIAALGAFRNNDRRAFSECVAVIILIVGAMVITWGKYP